MGNAAASAKVVPGSPPVAAWSLWVLAVSLTLLYLIFHGSEWQGNDTLHTVMESISSILAFFVGMVAMMRYYGKKSTMFLFIGTGFLGTAVLDGYHAVVTSVFVAPFLPSTLPSLSPWSWFATRLFLSILLFLSWLSWFAERQGNKVPVFVEKNVYITSIALTVATLLFFALVPLPRAYYHELFFHRPEEFVPAVFFLAALAGYYLKGAWRHDPFEYWLIVSLIVGAIAQAVFMSLSNGLFDFAFDTAHLLKIVSYSCVLIGLSSGMYVAFRQVDLTQDRLHDLADNMEAVIDTAVDGIILIDETGMVQRINPACRRMFGYTANEIVGENVKRLMPRKYADHHDQYLESYARTKQAKVIGIGREVTGRRKDGSEFPLDLSVGEMSTRNKGYVGVVRDITERRRAEEELEAYARRLKESNEELEQYAYIAAHDLQEPLRMISSYVDLLQRRYRDKLDDEARDFIGYAVDGAKRMQGLIDDLLSFSRASREEMVADDVDCNTIVQLAVTSLTRAMEDSRAEATWENLPVVTGHSGLLTQLFQNLIANAIKFRSEDPPRVHVEGRYQPGSWAFSVSDNGIGIEREYRDRIFRMFQRLHGRDEFSGSGIGLALCKKIVERHGGTIWADSNETNGTTIHFTLREHDGRHARCQTRGDPAN